MVFNSAVFIYFFLIVYAIYWCLAPLKKGRVWQNRFLLLASYFFYGWWDWIFLGLIAISTITDYVVALVLESSQDNRKRRIYMMVSLAVNLGMLGVFKYYDFFADSLVAALGYANPSQALQSSDWILLKVVLPVGISFYTFQTLSYTIDVYRRQIPAEKNFLDFALFVSFFPQLVAGPIERAEHLLPQFKTERRFTYKDLKAGAWLILYGFFMKTVVADGVGPLIDQVYGPNKTLYLANLAIFRDGMQAGQILVASLAFVFQIYGDFAGYSLIAMGSARMLGIQLTLNFDTPVFSQNPAELWRRWHATLNRWLTDYVYIPLGGSHYGKVAQFRNLFMVFVLTGLWHGANWTFIVWGAYMGIWMLSYMLLRPYLPALPQTTALYIQIPVKIAKMLLCFFGFGISALLFRSFEIEQSYVYLSTLAAWPLQMMGMLDGPAFSMAAFVARVPSGSVLFKAILGQVWLLVLLDFFWYRSNDPQWIGKRALWVRTAIYSSLFLLITLKGVFGKDVIYFAF